MNAPEKRPGQWPKTPAARPENTQRLRTWMVGGALLALVLGGYWYFNAMPGDSGAKRAAGAPVRVASVVKRDMAVVERSLGTIIAFNTVEVTARVQGTLDSAHFKEGQFVKKGDLLFQIDPRPFEAALAGAEAIYQKDMAQMQNAVRDRDRYAALSAQGAISIQQRDISDTNARVLISTVAADKAALDMARLNLQYTRILSPIDGKTGPILIQPGNMISSAGASSSAALVEISQVRPVKISFTLPQSDLARIQARQKTGRLLAILAVKNGAGGTIQAPVDFVSNAVSNQTGTIELRATFANDDLSLVPGQLVNVTVQLNDIPGALVVPRDAVNHGPDSTYVFAVRKGAAVEVPVGVLTDDGANAAVTGALVPGESVVVEGQLRVVPGGDVHVIKGGKAGAAPQVGL
ncbi:MAG TPA: efflux RND transporter periplasmic adaptor subunit [Rhizomicrobium sp.]|nr:efflux RND transporter periplasmic adaptor subunit [Rhizomicrobium sp.]